MSRWFGRASYLLAVTAFVAIALEVLLRLVASDPDYYWDYRFQFFSPNIFQNRGDNLWTYRPHTDIREAAVYATLSALPPRPRFVVEYDCRMRSNNLGLLQDDDVAPGTAVTVVVGDSFTAGQGGCPWFDRLQARRPGDRLVNAGLMGTGFEYWARLLKFIRNQGIVVERLLVIAISNDFKRRAGEWSKAALACLDDNVCPHAYLLQPAGLAEPESELIRRAAATFSKRFAGRNSIDFIRWYLDDHSFLLKFGERAKRTLRAMIEGSNADTPNTALAAIIPETAAALASFKALGIPIQVLMVPQRNEIGLLGDTVDPAAAVATLQSNGVAYRWCPLSREDFMPNDGHPNRQGYDKLVACADQVLTDMSAPRS